MKRYAIILPLLLAACGGTITKPGATQAQINKDTAACNYEMHKADVASATDDFGSAYRAGKLFNDCMAMRGYVPAR